MPNRLAQETSPYLQQHADNPVDWFPWGEEALRCAREQNKPILLSIGYSACHWCHVMAHESFEDADVAAVMNQNFINIKVDREERPDLDHIYQAAHNMLTRRNGGWPLTLFLTPDQMPFFGGTYFPKQARYNLPGFAPLLERVAELYRTRQDDIAKQSVSLMQEFGTSLTSAENKVSFNKTSLEDAFSGFQQSFDPIYGGFGGAPKFPLPTEMEFLLRYATHGGNPDARRMVLYTLRKMADGGIYDQLGGGFCRYSVDERWEIPHFEKMLYDNGPLLALYTDAYVLSGEASFKRVMQGISGWVMREMQSPQGGYYSGLDADSEHEEGKFYVWTPDEVKAALSADEYKVVAPHYGLDAPANFEHKDWHLQVVIPLDEVARKLALPLERVEALLDSSRTRLLARRARRLRPARDEKILTGWNALMIKGMAHGARVFEAPQWLRSARRAADFIHANLWRDGRLLASFKDDRAELNGYLDDYAFLLDALLELMQAEFKPADLVWARELAEVLLARFEDRENGGFFFVSHDHEQLLHRAKIGARNDTPSGNSVAAFALDRLGHMLGEPRYSEAARRTIQVFSELIEQQPNAHGMLGIALDEQLKPPTLVVLSGSADYKAWQRALATQYLPHVITLAIPDGASDLPPTLMKPGGAGIRAWVCQGVTCLPPITDLAALLEVVHARD